MVELIATIVLLLSAIGMAAIIFRKIPVLIGLPEVPAKFSLKENLLKLKEKIKIFNPFRYFSNEVFLQKILSRIRILTLKVENKTANWLQKLRARYQRKKNLENDNYWQELKKPKNKENKNLPR